MNNNELSPFARWHGDVKLIGRDFIEKLTGTRISRFMLYLKFVNRPDELEKLKTNTHEKYYQVDKDGWKDGYRIEV